MSRTLVVVGASAGGVQPLMDLVAGLPADYPGTVLIVLHSKPGRRSLLPRILGRAGALPVQLANDGERLQAGTIYVAPSDQHLLVDGDRIRLSRGPRENRCRPAIDPLFRTAALSRGADVVGVILSGTLGDGALGLAFVKRHGGVAVVQDTAEAAFDEMPLRALAGAEVDYQLPAAEIGGLLARLAREDGQEGREPEVGAVAREADADRGAGGAMGAMDSEALRDHDLRPGEPNGASVPLSCPDCGGTLWEVDAEGGLQYRCRVGHRFAPEALLAGRAEQVEEALWTAIRALEEQGVALRRFAARFEARGLADLARSYEERARDVARQADLLRDLVLTGALRASPLKDEG